jgi:hypothetical protein
MEWLCKARQKTEAFALSEEYFKNPDCLTWDDFYERLIRMSMDLSAELLQRVPFVMKSMMGLSGCISAKYLGNLLCSFVQRARLRVTDGQKLAAHCRTICPQEPHPEVLSDIFVDPFLNYLHGVYSDVLEAVRTSIGCGSVFEKIAILGFQAACDFSSEELFGVLTAELKNFCNNPNLKVDQQFSVVRISLARYEACVECGLFKGALDSLIDASFYINENSPRLIREKVEIEKSVFLQTLNERLLGAVQLVNLYDFYESVPVAPIIPTMAIADLALMSALASPIEGQLRYPRAFISLLNGNIPTRRDLIEKLMSNARRSPLKTFAMSAELHQDIASICTSFQAFIKEFGKAYRVPRLFSDLGFYAGIRIVQAFSVGREWVDITEVMRAVPWLSILEVHSVIAYAVRNGIIRARICTAMNRLRFS